MRNILTAGAVIAAIVSGAAADDCSGNSQEIGGNWYCSAVKAITYQGVGGSGSYNQVTNMDVGSGSCSSQQKSYNGAMAPMDEEVSLHFRGPLNLKQFAVYTPNSASSKKRSIGTSHHRRHGHQHFHEHNKEIREIQERDGAEVVATMNGQVVSWENTYNVATSAPESSAASTTAPSSSEASATSEASSSSAVETASPSANVGGSGSWSRQAYYDSSSGTADGLVFLNHNGGSGSGTFDYSFGASLSYASSDGKSGASSPQTLEDTTLPSNVEVVIMSDKECSNGDCGYTRDNTVAHHGFDGAEKAFLFEFGMPDDGQTGINGNMPAIWMLNAQIPRTLQYGKPECSCWTSGCGEFDLFEVLDSGNTRCKSTFHMNPAGGDSDYFDRPTSGTVKAAVVFTGDQETAHIQILDDSVNFGSSFSSSDIQGFVSQESNGGSSSLFKLGS